jgi:hypothetical protein
MCSLPFDDSVSILVHKKCCTCKNIQPLSSFNKNKRFKDGHGYQCKTCSNAYVNTEKYRKRVYIKRYKATENDWIYYESQTNCECCGKLFTDLNFKCQDHCHVTHKLRGIICDRCNKLEGSIKNKEHFYQVLNYIKINN